MSDFCVGTMTTEMGWEIQSPVEAISRHFTYWLISRRNQGKVMGKVPSFFYLFMKFSRTPDTLVEKAKQELDDYFGEISAQRNVAVTYKYINDTKSLYTVQFDIQVIIDGIMYDLGRSIEITGEFYREIDKMRLGK